MRPARSIVPSRSSGLPADVPSLSEREDWTHVRFGDVVKNCAEATRDPLAAGYERYVGLEHLEPGSLRIRSWGLVADGTSFSRVFRKGQVLFGKRRAYQRKVAVADFDGICSSDILVFEPKGEDLIPELLPFIVQSEGFFDHALGTSAGSLSPRTRWSQLAQYEFPLPPRDEQRRITAIFRAAEESAEGLMAAERHLASLLDVIVRDFLARGLPGRHTQFVETEIGTLPAGWECAQCDTLFENPPRNGFSPQAESGGDGYPTLSIGAVRDGKVIAEGNLKFAVISDDELKRFRLESGDLLVVRGNGNRSFTGRCGMVETVPTNCFYPDLLIRIRFKPQRVLAEFACLQWNAGPVHKRLLKFAKSTNGIWKVNGKDLRQHRLAVPPLKEQEEFLELVRGPNEQLRRLDAAVDTARQLKTTLMNDLLGG